MKLKFNNSEEEYEINNFIYENSNVIYTDCMIQNTSGFILYTDDGIGHNFSDYITIYQITDNYIYYSNNNSTAHDTTIITATFDGEKPDKVDVTISNGEIITLSGDFTTTLLGHNLFIINAEQLDNYNVNCQMNIAIYTTKPESQKIADQINNLKVALAKTNSSSIELSDDFVKFKLGMITEDEYLLKAEEYKSTLEEREAIREKIKELENKA